MDRLEYGDICIRQAKATDAKQLTAWWNDGTVMEHAGFPNGLGTTEEEVIAKLRLGILVIEESGRLIVFFILTREFKDKFNILIELEFSVRNTLVGDHWKVRKVG